MSTVLKNVFFLSLVILTFGMTWVFFEISKSQKLIDLAQDPSASIMRGNIDAESDFQRNHLHFKELYIEGVGFKVLGISEKYLENEFKEYKPPRYFTCGYGLHFEKIALDITKYEHNEQYVLAYNIKLSSLILGQKILTSLGKRTPQAAPMLKALCIKDEKCQTLN